MVHDLLDIFRSEIGLPNLGIRHDFLGVFEDLSVDKAGEIGRYIVEDYTTDNLDSCYLVYNEFKSAISQEVVIEPFLPIEPMKLAEDRLGDFIYEPSQTALLNSLLPMYVEVEIYRALLESVASEHGARMTAMDAATNNANDMIDRLTLQYNRARQAQITQEIAEIVGVASTSVRVLLSRARKKLLRNLERKDR